MSPTELMLLAIYRSPAIPVEEISKTHFDLNGTSAARLAALNQLPFPTFKLTTSAKAPLMVHLSDLAAHIDNQRTTATESWTQSQL